MNSKIERYIEKDEGGYLWSWDVSPSLHVDMCSPTWKLFEPNISRLLCRDDQFYVFAAPYPSLEDGG